MRRTACCRCQSGAAFQSWKWVPKPDKTQAEKHQEWADAEHKARAANAQGDHGQKTIKISSNPIVNKYDAEIQLSKSKFGKLQTEATNYEYAAHQEDLVKWMTAKQAAQILNIPEAKLYGLRLEEVEEAWAMLYPKATHERQRHEINAAAEHLADYSRSHFAQERTKDHFTMKIMEAKKDVAAAIAETTEKNKSMAYKGLGIGHFIVTAGFTITTVLMYRYMEKSDAELAVIKAKRHFAHATSAVVNDEPAPEYQTRYRDTPTTLDERLAQPHPEITDPGHRAVLLAVDESTRREEVLLSGMTSDVRAEAEARMREQINRQSLKQAIQHMSPLDIMDAMVKAAPPPALRDLRKQQSITAIATAAATVARARLA